MIFDIGVQGHLGMQISEVVGLYLAPFVDMAFGAAYGPNLGSAIVVDFTIADSVALASARRWPRSTSSAAAPIRPAREPAVGYEVF